MGVIEVMEVSLYWRCASRAGQRGVRAAQRGAVGFTAWRWIIQW